MKFFQERFEYVADEDSAIAYLRDTHDRFLPKVFARPDDPQDEPDIVIPSPDELDAPVEDAPLTGPADAAE